MDAISSFIVEKLIGIIEVIDSCNLDYIEYGLFGSVARSEYNGCSDVDIVFIVNKLIPSKEFASLAGDLESLHCDVAQILLENFNNPKNAFHRNIAKDYRRIKIGK